MIIQCTQFVKIHLNEGAFTEEFMKEFRDSFYPFFRIEEHAEHIAQLIACGICEEIHIDYNSGQFIEGYGLIDEFVDHASVCDSETEHYS